MTTEQVATGSTGGRVQGLAKIVGFLVCVELASGILQGYYTPIYQDIAGHLSIEDASVNWFEAAQLVVSALAVPLLARLGDLVGARNVLLLSTAITAVGSWILAFAPGFTTFLIGFAIQGAYVVWLPMEVAIVYRRTSSGALITRRDLLTRRAAGVLVGALELAVIVGAVTSGALVGATSFTVVLMIPAIVVTAALVVIWFGIERDPPAVGGRIDLGGLALVSLSIGLVMGGLIAIRLQGVGHPLGWALIVVGLGVLVPFVRHELRHDEPLVDVRLLATPLQWPVQVTAFLFGMSVLGAQIPLSTFARTDPDVAGYGLGATAGFVSTLIGVYVIFLAIGAFTLPLTTRWLGAAQRAGALGAARGPRLRAVGALPRLHEPGPGQHGDRRHRVRRPRRSPARQRRRRSTARPHRLRHRHDQRDQDHRWRHRLGDLRDRPVEHRVHRRPGQGPRTPPRLPRRLVRVRHRSPPRRRRPPADAAGDGRTRPVAAVAVLGRHAENGAMGDSESPDRTPERDERTGRAAAAQRMQNKDQWVDLQIQEAMKRGDFDNLPGAGKPIEGLGRPARPRLVAQEARRAREDQRPPSRPSSSARTTPSSTRSSTATPPSRRYAASSRSSTPG